jgi:hypothetical protein
MNNTKMNKDEFINYFNNLYSILSTKYDIHRESKNTNLKRSLLEDLINEIAKANILRKRADIFVKEETRKSSNLLDDCLRYFEKELTDTYIIQKEIPEISNKKHYTEYNWFKIGLLFAQGKPQILHKKYKGNFVKITEELGVKYSNKPFISETFGSTSKSNNNIYNSISKMQKIFDYCMKNNIPVNNNFSEQLKILISKNNKS